MLNINKKLPKILKKKCNIVNYINLKNGVIKSNLKSIFNIFIIKYELNQKNLYLKNNFYYINYNKILNLNILHFINFNNYKFLKKVKFNILKNVFYFDIYKKHVICLFFMKFIHRFVLHGNVSQILKYFYKIFFLLKKKYFINLFFLINIFSHFYKIPFLVKKKKQTNKTIYVLQSCTYLQYNFFFLYLLKKIKKKKKIFLFSFLQELENLYFNSTKSFFIENLSLLLNLANQSKTNITNIKPPLLQKILKRK